MPSVNLNQAHHALNKDWQMILELAKQTSFLELTLVTVGLRHYESLDKKSNMHHLSCSMH